MKIMSFPKKPGEIPLCNPLPDALFRPLFTTLLAKSVFTFVMQ